jgi:hypothetical protein
MKSSAKFFSACIVIILTGLGLFFASTKSFDFFSDKENIFLRKIIVSKPKNMKVKQALVASGISTLEDFTFFDTLDDPAMKKYLSLNGSISLLKDENYYKSNDLTPRVNLSPASKVTRPVSENIFISSTRILKDQNHTEQSTKGFVLQMGSFQEFQRANYLKNKLNNNDYPAFISSSWVEEKRLTLHRVFVGTFFKKIDAEKAAVEIKKSEKLESLIKFYKKKS